MNKKQMRHLVEKYCTDRLHKNPNHPCRDCPQNGSRFCCADNYWDKASIATIKADFAKFQKGEPIEKEKEKKATPQRKPIMTEEEKRQKQNEYHQRWATKNKEKYQQYRKEYYQKNKERILNNSKKFYYSQKEI